MYLIDVFASYEHYDPKYNLYDEPHIVDVSIDQLEAFTFYLLTNQRPKF